MGGLRSPLDAGFFSSIFKKTTESTSSTDRLTKKINELKKLQDSLSKDLVRLERERNDLNQRLTQLSNELAEQLQVLKAESEKQTMNSAVANSQATNDAIKEEISQTESLKESINQELEKHPSTPPVAPKPSLADRIASNNGGAPVSNNSRPAFFRPQKNTKNSTGQQEDKAKSGVLGSFFGKNSAKGANDDLKDRRQTPTEDQPVADKAPSKGFFSRFFAKKDPATKTAQDETTLTKNEPDTAMVGNQAPEKRKNIDSSFFAKRNNQPVDDTPMDSEETKAEAQPTPDKAPSKGFFSRLFAKKDPASKTAPSEDTTVKAEPDSALAENEPSVAKKSFWGSLFSKSAADRTENQMQKDSQEMDHTDESKKSSFLANFLKPKTKQDDVTISTSSSPKSQSRQFNPVIKLPWLLAKKQPQSLPKAHTTAITPKKSAWFGLTNNPVFNIFNKNNKPETATALTQPENSQEKAHLSAKKSSWWGGNWFGEKEVEEEDLFSLQKAIESTSVAIKPQGYENYPPASITTSQTAALSSQSLAEVYTSPTPNAWKAEAIDQGLANATEELPLMPDPKMVDPVSSTIRRSTSASQDYVSALSSNPNFSGPQPRRDSHLVKVEANNQSLLWVLKQICGQLGLDLVISQHATLYLDDKISLDLKDAPVNHALDWILGSTDLRYKIHNGKLEI